MSALVYELGTNTLNNEVIINCCS